MEILNRKARFNYVIIDTLECGIVLKGTEIKSIRDGKANIKDSYGIIRNNEIFVLNMHISPYENGGVFNHQETRTRKLLLHKREILKLKNKLELEGFTLIPLKLYFVNGKAKIELGLCKGKKLYDKRESSKKRDIEREIAKKYKR